NFRPTILSGFFSSALSLARKKTHPTPKQRKTYDSAPLDPLDLPDALTQPPLLQDCKSVWRGPCVSSLPRRSPPRATPGRPPNPSRHRPHHNRAAAAGGGEGGSSKQGRVSRRNPSPFARASPPLNPIFTFAHGGHQLASHQRPA
uniref:Uncharacterized protein n=1 Tax=Aegilops tauschii subsp. strangulata TaxID=200361 RepID=A0A453GJK6_AEGTS